jgi:hypothetical protein
MKRWWVFCLMLAAAIPAVAGSRGRPIRIVPVKPSPRDAVSEFADHLRVLPASRHANLALYPVVVAGVPVSDIDMPLDQAVNKGLVEVTELKSADVNRLRVYSRAKEPVFVMAGEILRGGKQDRIIADDLIIPPHADLTVDVYCVEHGRWVETESRPRPGRGGGGGARGDFSAGHSLAGGGMRAGARSGGQTKVWETVADQQTRLRAPSATGAYRSVHDSADVRSRMKPYLAALSDLAADNPKASGVVVVMDDEIVVADLFSSPALFHKLWPQLLEAYVIDALDHAEESGWHARRDEKGRPEGTARVERWLEGLRQADRTPRDTPGAGQLYDLNGHDLTGSALLSRHAVLHLGLFPSAEVVEKEPQYNPMDYRRGRMRGGR